MIINLWQLVRKIITVNINYKMIVHALLYAMIVHALFYHRLGFAKDLKLKLFFFICQYCFRNSSNDAMHLYDPKKITKKGLEAALPGYAVSNKI